MKKAILGLVFLLLSIPAFAAASWSGGMVKNVEITSSGNTNTNVAYIEFTTTGGGASCGSTHADTLSIDLTTASGPSLLAVALRALSLGIALNATGTGTCTYTGFEAISELNTSS